MQKQMNLPCDMLERFRQFFFEIQWSDYWKDWRPIRIDFRITNKGHKVEWCHVLSVVALSRSTIYTNVQFTQPLKSKWHHWWRQHLVELTVKMSKDTGLLTRDDLLVAMDNLEKSEKLKVKRTPCILVNDGDGG